MKNGEILSDGTLKIASCQFAVSDDINQNAELILSYIREARAGGAEIVHFSECALSGYAGTDFSRLEGYDWELLRSKTEEIIEAAGREKVWVVLGSTHRLTEPNRPYNSLYLISPEGKVVDRYDKRFLTESDLNYYSAGDHFVTFDINGIRCGLLICFDLRFPEVYRELYKLEVDVVLQSFYNAKQKETSVHSHIMRQTMQCRAASNFMWVSMVNSSGYYSPYGSCFMTSDGVIANELKQNEAGMMINVVDKSQEFYDPMVRFREMVIDGKLSNGVIVEDDERKKRDGI